MKTHHEPVKQNQKKIGGEIEGGFLYEFERGYPTEETIKQAYDDVDLNRAIQAYRFFYPTVSSAAIFKGNFDVGMEVNKKFGIIDTKPRHLIFTPNSDTPYGPVILDLKDGPITVELPPGPLICLVIDLNQRWVADMGLPSPDAGKGGKHIILPPDYEGVVPSGYYASKSTTFKVLIGVRSLPLGGDLEGAVMRIKDIKVRPLNLPKDWTDPEWINFTDTPQDTTPVKFERNLKFWEVLAEVINTEPVYDPYRSYYGELAVLGIIKGKPFVPDARMKRILEKAAQVGNDQMRVQAFADRRQDKIVWEDLNWEWASLRFENGHFDAPTYTDLDAREKWYYQAIGASPSMFRRNTSAGSLYWLGLRDERGAYLDGGKLYKLRIPLPVPANLFWSVTVYDNETRSEISTDQGKAALRSLFELKNKSDGTTIDLYFGPNAPSGVEGQWIKTIPGKGWFTYFRLYGPEEPAFNGGWKLSDFIEV